ncbi:MAG: nitroreductase family protein [Bacillota bacterium]|nr:nitroreductase family protein [Bacillota bacterium]
MNTLEAIHKRVSIRHYTEEPISEEDQLTLMKAAMAAPSGMNVQPWEFYLVSDKATQDKIKEGHPYAKYDSQLIIVLAINKSRLGDKPGDLGLALCDMGACAENILLAVTELNLGAVWCALYPSEERSEATRLAIGAPEEIMPYCLIHVGHISRQFTPKDKFKPERIHKI